MRSQSYTKKTPTAVPSLIVRLGATPAVDIVATNLEQQLVAERALPVLVPILARLARRALVAEVRP